MYDESGEKGEERARVGEEGRDTGEVEEGKRGRVRGEKEV